MVISINFLGFYDARCNTTVSDCNCGSDYLRQFHKNLTNFSPGKYTKKFIVKINKIRTCIKQNSLVQIR